MLIYTKNTFKRKTKKSKSMVEYEMWLAKHGVTKKKEEKKEVYKPPVTVRREVSRAPSLDTGIGNATKPIEGKRYTGSSMIGIATMHKSNLVPVFKEESCVELASMRR